MKSFSFKKGPCILAEFTTSSDQILQIYLKISNHFKATVQGSYSLLLLNKIHQWLEQYQNSVSLPSLPLEMALIPSFRKKVLLTLQKTNLGETLSYKLLAEQSLSPKAYRAVGSACKNNPFPLVIPCHRVICSNGNLGQFNGGIEIKKRLLQFEKAVF